MCMPCGWPCGNDADDQHAHRRPIGRSFLGEDRSLGGALLGKHLGMDRKDIQLKIDQPRIEDMVSEELAAELEIIRANIISMLSPAELEVEKARVTEELRRVEIACGGDSTTVFTAQK